jgi:hypothetical protein
MAIPATRERVDYGAPEGCTLYGVHREVITGWTTGRQLNAGESGALITFDTAAGQTITLPVPVVGMYFDFVVHVTGTGTYSVATGSSAIFIGGGVDGSSTEVAEGGDTFVADPTGTVDVVMDSDVTMRLVGGHFRLTAISSTVWNIEGTMMGVGTLATPF